MALFNVPGQFDVPHRGRYVAWTSTHNGVAGRGVMVMLLDNVSAERCLRHLPNIGTYNQVMSVYDTHIAPIINGHGNAVQNWQQVTISGGGWTFILSWEQAHLLVFHIHPDGYTTDDKRSQATDTMAKRLESGGSYRDRMQARSSQK